MLHETGALELFCTDICAVKGWPRLLAGIPRALQPESLRRLLGRIPYGVPRSKVSAFTSTGWAYSKARREANNPSQSSATNILFGRKFCEAILHHGVGNATAVYTFNSAGLELMRYAQRRGLKRVMEQTIAPKAVELELLAEAVQRFPSWRQVEFSDDSVDLFIAREEAEWEHADLILCGSEFVRNGIALRGGPVDRCRVVPYGVDNHFQQKRASRPVGPLRVLTVGQVGLRKGSPTVWEVAEMVGGLAEFRMVGSLDVPHKILSQKPSNVELTGPVPRSEIMDQYSWADIFLLPSLCEGSATVTYEAMMSGLPVICTENTGSIIQHGVNGYIVQNCNPDQIADHLFYLADNLEVLSKLSNVASKSSEAVSLCSYRKRLSDVLEEL
jgi:glycosyltransferase involved in cell wall biosynthesis